MPGGEALAVAAARNNAEWCNAVVRRHAGAGVFLDEAWFTNHPAPRFYPNVVTLDRLSHEQQFTVVDDVIAAIGHQHEIGVKDSFAALDLTSRGFSVIIDGQWIARSQQPALPDIGIETIATARALTEWEHAWGQGSTTTGPTFRPELLDDTDLVFLAQRDGQELVAGLIANRSADVAGISNFFAPSADARDFLVRALGCGR